MSSCPKAVNWDPCPSLLRMLCLPHTTSWVSELNIEGRGSTKDAAVVQGLIAKEEREKDG